MSADGGKGQPVDLKKAMDSASRLRWAAAHSSELVSAAEEFDRAREAVAALVEALEDLCAQLGECGMTERARAALRAAGVEL